MNGTPRKSYATFYSMNSYKLLANSYDDWFNTIFLYSKIKFRKCLRICKRKKQTSKKTPFTDYMYVYAMYIITQNTHYSGRRFLSLKLENVNKLVQTLSMKIWQKDLSVSMSHFFQSRNLYLGCILWKWAWWCAKT